MRRTAGAVLMRFEQLPEEAGNAIEERRNAGTLDCNKNLLIGRKRKRAFLHRQNQA